MPKPSAHAQFDELRQQDVEERRAERDAQASLAQARTDLLAAREVLVDAMPPRTRRRPPAPATPSPGRSRAPGSASSKPRPRGSGGTICSNSTPLPLPRPIRVPRSERTRRCRQTVGGGTRTLPIPHASGACRARTPHVGSSRRRPARWRPDEVRLVDGATPRTPQASDVRTCLAAASRSPATSSAQYPAGGGIA
jgi:hypothetical protein